MKKFLTLAFLAALATSANAVILGVDTGYLIDSEDAFISVRAGGVVSVNERVSHQIDLELGFTNHREIGFKGEILPLMLNYRVESRGVPGWGYFAGLGAGAARTEVSGLGLSFDDTSFAAQGFGGVKYAFTETTSLNLGLKYIWIDDVDFGFGSFEVGDDLAVTLGFGFRF